MTDATRSRAVERRSPRTIKLPPPSELESHHLADFLTLLGYDAAAQRRVTAVHFNSRRVSVQVRGRADVRLTVEHPIVWED